VLACRNCRAWFDLETLSKCPICGSLGLIDTDIVEQDDRGRTGFNLAFGLFGCDDCGTVYGLDEELVACPICGAPHDLPDLRVEKRVQFFGPGLVRLQERLEFAHGEPIATRGSRMAESEYVTWLRSSFLYKCLGWGDTLIENMSRGNFNEPDLAETQAAWTDLQGFTNEVIDYALWLKRHPGPVQLTATHRTLIRVVLLFASATVGFLTGLTAPTVSVARRRGDEAQEQLDHAGSLITQACDLSIDSDNHDSDLPTGSAASVVFPELTRLAVSDPVLLRPLIPFCSLSRRGHDPFRRAARVETVQATLQRATQAAPSWAEPTDILLSRCASGWRKLVAQHVRLVRILDDDRERAGWVDDIFDIATKVAEGPYRLYGGIVLVASKVADGTESNMNASASDRHRNFPVVLRGLAQVTPLLTEGVDALVRHAEAHYDYTVEGGRISLHPLPPGHGASPRTDEFHFDDLLAAVLNLFELGLAMAIGVLKWMWDNGSIAMKERHRQDWLAT
jgi:RNA polymerase subunit RPABC4/transcription elongation factor Spt4